MKLSPLDGHNQMELENFVMIGMSDLDCAQRLNRRASVYYMLLSTTKIQGSL